MTSACYLNTKITFVFVITQEEAPLRKISFVKFNTLVIMIVFIQFSLEVSSLLTRAKLVLAIKF